MTTGLTTIAALPSAGGCKSALAAEVCNAPAAPEAREPDLVLCWNQPARTDYGTKIDVQYVSQEQREQMRAALQRAARHFRNS
jgi:hypothetical protein